MSKKLMVSIMIFIIIFSTITCANSAEPPSLIIVVPSQADQIEISVSGQSDELRSNKIDKVFETYYQFYQLDLKQSDPLTVYIDTGDEKFSIKIDEPLNKYRETYTLDLENQTLKKGYDRPFLNVFLILTRILLTLLIEGFIFYILGFRWKQSWRIFIIINLVTQGALNIWLSTFSLASGYSIYLALIFAEVLILILEMIAFFMGVNEKSKLILFVHVVIANGLSFVLGGYLMTWLPL